MGKVKDTSPFDNRWLKGGHTAREERQMGSDVEVIEGVMVAEVVS